MHSKMKWTCLFKFLFMTPKPGIGDHLKYIADTDDERVNETKRCVAKVMECDK